MAAAHNARVLARGLIPVPGPVVPKIEVTTITKKKKPLLNRTESLFKAELERRGYKNILAQSITLRIGDDCRYTCDLVTIEPVQFFQAGKSPTELPFYMTFWETKGPHGRRREGINKLKAAAKLYPQFRFVLIDRNGSKWTEKEVGNE